MNTIPTRPLGASGLTPTEIGLGLWAQGGGWGPTDDAGALDAIDAALELAVNFFDTADVYGNGHSEALLAKAMRNRRDKFIVASKIGWVGYDGERNRSQYDTVPKLIAGVEENLTRLDTDHLDLIQCHIHYPEPNTPVFIDGFLELKRQGKVRAFGVSTSDLNHLKTFAATGECDALQIDCSILNRTPETDILPFCKDNDIGIIVRGPLAMGILTGKLTPDTTFEDGDFRKAWIDDPDQNALYRRDLETVAQLQPLTSDGQTLSQMALGFTLSNDAVTTVIPGARNRRQAEMNSSAASFAPLTREQLAAINAIVPPGGGRKIWPA